MAEIINTPRLMAAAKEFNLGKDTIVDFLVGKGFDRNLLKPTAKLTEQMYRALQNEFKSDKVAKLKVVQIDLPKGVAGEAKKKKDEEDFRKQEKKPAAKETPEPAPVPEHEAPKAEPEVIKQEVPEIEELKINKIDLSAIDSSTFPIKHFKKPKEEPAEQVKPVGDEPVVENNKAERLKGPKILGRLELPVDSDTRPKPLDEKRKRKRIPIETRDVRPATFIKRRISWQDLKNRYRVGAELELTVAKKAAPGLLFFYITDKFLGVLHVSELNWNFGLSQLDYKTIAVSSKLKVKVVGFEDRANQVHLSRKSLPSIQRPSTSNHWKNLSLKEEIQATIFEVFRNKVWVQLNTGLFATLPLVDGKPFRAGDKLMVIPVRKNEERDIVECVLQEAAADVEQQRSNVIDGFQKQTVNNEFSTSEFCLNSYKQLSESFYWNYFSDEEKDFLREAFDATPYLFSKAERGSDPIFFEFDFNGSAYTDFINQIAPYLFDASNEREAYSEKELLLQLSSLTFWYTQFETSRKVDGTNQNVSEKLFSLFNENVSIRGSITDDGALKIKNIKAKIKSAESLKEKQIALKKNNVIYLHRPIVFSQYAPPNTANKDFVRKIDYKLLAFKIFEIAREKSLNILQEEGKDFKIFKNYLESQIDFEIKKAANDVEYEIKECKLEIDIQTDGITFTGRVDGECNISIDDKISISIKTDKRPKTIGIGAIQSKSNGRIIIQSNVENFGLLEGGCIIKRTSSTKQFAVQLDVLNKFFLNQLPLESFYQVFHDKNNIAPPEDSPIEFENKVFEGKNNPQTVAVKKAVGNKNILLIQGPPGTGKTTVITEIVRQLIKKGEKVLVTSQTHIAVDNVLERIKDDSKITIARIGRQDTASDFASDYLIEEARKRFAEKVQKIVDVKIQLINHHNAGRDILQLSKESFDVPMTFDWQNIENFISLLKRLTIEQSKKIIETLEHWKQVIAKTPKLLTDIFLQNLNVLFGTCIGIATNKEISESNICFDTVILDEAGKANISETLTAISKGKKIILVGDHKQLPPYLDRDAVDYFKKFSREFIDQKINDEDIKKALGGSFFEYLQKDGVLSHENKVLLAVQHRMHPDIGNFISQAFYDSELENGEKTKENVLNLPGPFDKQIIFIDTSSDNGSSESFKDGSYFNEVEAQFIVNKIIPELASNNVSLQSYAIVSPYSKQCQKITELIYEKDAHDYKAIEVATLDSFQGREHDVIIFSFTRSSKTSKVGFLDDARRLNVAFSRAKKKLILIGNVETLKSTFSHYDSYYATLFNNLWHYSSRYGKTYRINELNFEKTITTLNVGETRKGKVRNIIDSLGVFVTLGTKDGLIPRSFIVSNPTSLFHIGTVIDVIIHSIDADNKITLSIPYKSSGNKALDNYKQFKSKFQKGEVVKGKIQKIKSISHVEKLIYVELEFSVIGIFRFKGFHNKIRYGQEIALKINFYDDLKYLVKGEVVL